MKKALVSTAVLLLCLALLCACQQKPKLTVGALSDLNVRDDLGITLTVDAKTLTREGAAFAFSNETSSPCHYGDDFRLEVWADDGWHSIEAVPYYLFMGENQATGEPAELSLDWSADCGKLPKGEYRLLADILPSEGKDAEPFYVSCEFAF